MPLRACLSLQFAVCCVGSSLCDEPIILSEKPSQMCEHLTVRDVENSKRGSLGPNWALVPNEGKNYKKCIYFKNH